MNTQKEKRVPRPPGQIVFDRCFLPVAAIVILRILWIFFQWHAPSELDYYKKYPFRIPLDFEDQFWFMFGLVLVALWIRASLTLIKFWGDPSLKYTRLAACLLFIVLGITSCNVLLRHYSKAFETKWFQWNSNPN